MPIIGLFIKIGAAVMAVSAVGVAARPAKEASKNAGGFGKALRNDFKELGSNLTELFRGGWK